MLTGKLDATKHHTGTSLDLAGPGVDLGSHYVNDQRRDGGEELHQLRELSTKRCGTSRVSTISE